MVGTIGGGGCGGSRGGIILSLLGRISLNLGENTTIGIFGSAESVVGLKEAFVFLGDLRDDHGRSLRALFVKTERAVRRP